MCCRCVISVFRTDASNPKQLEIVRERFFCLLRSNNFACDNSTNMASLLQYLLIIASVNVGVAFALYIGTDEHWLTYFSDTEITVSVEEYRRACERIIGYPVNARHQSEIDRIFASRPDNETYLIGRIGPHADLTSLYLTMMTIKDTPTSRTRQQPEAVTLE